MDAIEKIVGKVRSDKGKIVTAIFIDVKNAFNTANWDLILSKARRRGISPGLLRVLASYLKDRKVTLGPGIVEKVYAGVPQGSVLGPTLWNLLYDDVMHTCERIGPELVCYADDLAVVIQAKSVEDTIDQGNRALEAIQFWMESNRLEIAPEKTTSIVFSWSIKHRRNIKFVINGYEITPGKHAKYLGVTLDFTLTFTKHVEDLTDKAARIIKTLNILLANTCGPNMSKRRVLAGALQSALTYAAPIWAGVLQFERPTRKLKTHQRAIALRCCSGYSTVSADAAVVLAGMVPIDLLIKERARLRERLKGTPESDAKKVKADEREATLKAWQQQWTQATNDSTTAVWTRSLVRDIPMWINRAHGEVDYHLSQALTGHGCFQSYLYRIKKAGTPDCECQMGIIDDPEHTLFSCSRFRAGRSRLEAEIGEKISRDNMIEIMLRGKLNWARVQGFVKATLIQKETEERNRALLRNANHSQ